MTTPITWQNINGPDLTAAGRPLEAAQRSFTGAFDQLGQILSQRQRIEEQNWQNTRNNNTNAFLDRLAAYATPEQLAAAQQSGELAQLRQSFGPQIDTAAIRGAEEQRLNQLRTGAKLGWEYQNAATDQAQAGDVEKAKQLIANKDFAGAQALLDSKDLRQESVLWNALTQGRRANVVEGQQDTTFNNNQTKFGWEQQMQPLELAAKRASINSTNQSIAESQARVTHMGDEASDRKAARDLARLASSQGDKALNEEKANGAYSMGSYGTKEGKEALYKALKDIPGLDDGDKEDIVFNLEKYYKDGINVPTRKDEQGNIYTTKMPLPIAAVVQAIEGTEDSWFTFSSRRGDRVAEKLAERFGLNTGVTADYKTPSRKYESQYDKELVDSMLAYQGMLSDRQVRAQQAQERSAAAAAKKSRTR